MIVITSKKDGFRRAGIAHKATPVQYPHDAFTAEQLKALKAEPMLIVQEIPDLPPAEKEDPPPSPAEGEGKTDEAGKGSKAKAKK